MAARDAADGRLSEPELLANLVVLLVAGFETTTNLLGNGLAILLQRPELTAALRCGDMAISGFTEEVLRYDSPVQVTTRQARADNLTVAGVSIPTDSTLILLIGAANRDPDRFPDPDRFDPARSDIRPLSFGAGAHFCLGNGLARLKPALPSRGCSPASRLWPRPPTGNPRAATGLSCAAIRSFPSVWPRRAHLTRRPDPPVLGPLARTASNAVCGPAPCLCSCVS